MKEFNNDRDNFNKSLKQRFSEAAFEPSSNVWEGIETELLRADNAKMKKRALWYRNTAAAILLIALVSLYFNFNGNSFKEFANVNDIEPIDLNGSSLVLQAGLNNNYTAEVPSVTKRTDLNLLASRSSNKSSSLKRNETSSSADKGQKFVATRSSEGLNKSQNISSQNVFLNNDILTSNEAIALAQKSYINPETETKWTPIDIPVEEVSYFAVSELESNKKKESVNFQANLNFGSGSFNPNTNITSAPVNSTVSSLNSPGSAGRSFSSADSPEREIVEDLSSAPIKSNISLSYGINFGLRLSERWTIKSGLQYGNYRSSSQSSTVIRDVNSDEFLPYHGASSTVEVSDGKILNVTSTYNLNNNFEILSIPVFATYKLLNSKFGVGLVAGATADFILSNTITGSSEQIKAISFDANDQKSYRNTFASGTLGLELSYDINKHYGLTLTPLYKKALMDVTTNSANFSSTPAFASVNMSFQYIF
ncbi:hypothetical protein GCM10027429_12170 [Marivirga atlantica]|jgi:hypothetical protein|uniref:Outer membrane beta-barrel protein n=2 Tax=Marivirga atlantica TaxID=1548457 RepID=A0A937A739_9BACT|nr:outer membrane beta-barrel protein [Marivirga atlantica]